MRLAALTVAVVLSISASSMGPTPSPALRATPVNAFGTHPGIRSAGPVAPPSPVAPPAGHLFDDIDRDAGVSVRLSDGSVLWFFGDSMARSDVGEVKYFVLGSAGWADADDPTAPIDFDSYGEPVPFAVPTPLFPACPPEAPVAGMWPASAVNVPEHGRDRVIVFMYNVCLGPSHASASRGISVGEYWYDPMTPPTDRPLGVSMLNQTLFEGYDYGVASFLSDDGFIYTYGCDTDSSTAGHGPCRVGRVDPDHVADSERYEAWTGHAWVAGGAAAPLELPAIPGRAALVPPGPFSVDRHADSGLLFMVYSPFPAYSTVFHVRVASAPEGPWSPPAEIELPGCADYVEGWLALCYAANAQPFLNGPGRLGIGWYDQSVESGARRGAFLVTTVPLVISASTNGK